MLSKFDGKHDVISRFTYFNENIGLRILNRLYTELQQSILVDFLA